MRAKRTSGKIGKTVTCPCPDKHHPDHHCSAGKRLNRRRIDRSRYIPQENKQGKRHADVADTRHRNSRIVNRHIATQKDAGHQGKNRGCDHGKQNHTLLPDERAIQHSPDAKNTGE